MDPEKHTPRPPELAEAVFDTCYLLFDLIAGCVFLAKGGGKPLFSLYAALAWTLGFGDAFHLLPRVIRAVKGMSRTVGYWMNLGLQISSITMTAFYVLLLYIWRATFPEMTAPAWIAAMIWGSAILRVILCLLPQNRWQSAEGNPKLSLLRNAVFLLTGLGVILLYAMSGSTGGLRMNRMVTAIVISFGCYLPVVWGAKKRPMLGMLMIPKTLAYVWMLVMGLQLL